MPISEYALYALAVSVLSFLSVASDLGLTGAIGYFWRQRLLRENEIQIETIIVAVRRLRWLLLGLSGIVAGVMLSKSANTQNVPLYTVFFCFAIVLLTAALQTRISIDLLMVRIDGKLRQSYYCEAAGNAARLSVALAMIVFGIATAWFGLIAGLCGAIAAVLSLRLLRRPVVGSHVAPETWRGLFAYIGPTLPTMFVHMVQDPLIFWLVFTVGGQTSLSETFALGRIGVIYGVLGSFIITVVPIRLAHIVDKTHLARMVGLFLVVLLSVLCMLLALAYVVPWAFLMLLGPKYAHLDDELVVSLLGASIGVIVTFLVMVNRLQGWVRLEPVTAFMQLAAISTIVPLWSFRSSLDAIWLMVLLAMIGLLGIAGTTILGFCKPAWVKARQ
jgi:hypothetical protein